MQPIFEYIEYQSPQKLFAPFADIAGNVLIDSSDGMHEGYGTNRYSYILLDPFERYVYHSALTKNADPLATLRQKTTIFQLATVPNIPPFQGGIAGYLSYDLAHIYHPVDRLKHSEFDFPELWMGFYDVVCSFDHVQKKAYIVSTGFPECNEFQRLSRASARLNWLKSEILSEKIFKKTHQNHEILAINIHSNFTKNRYIETVNKVIHYIKAGDIFEANIAQRFSTKLPDAYRAYDLYQSISAINPSPFSAFMHLGDYKIISASPERFLSLQNHDVEARPIKGTRARSMNQTEDAANIADLLNSKKDFAENTMIVDLMRNDLSQFCEEDSVQVTQLCGHEIYPTVHHLVSVIKGQLKPNEDAFSMLKAAFPGGSITGAPKIRAMQIIAEIEPDARGPYCGSIVLIGFDGNMDSSILIRTYVIQQNNISFHAGGAIVIDSNPNDEYEETWVKSRALREALLK